MRRLLPAAIVATTAAVGCVDFWTAPNLVAAILFTVPLALCALQPSLRLLWVTAVAAAVLTVAAAFWGIDRVAPEQLMTGLLNRSLLVASLLTLTIFIFLWRRKTQQLDLDHRLLTAVVEGTTDLIYVRDLDNRFTLANTACGNLFRMTPQQLLGLSMDELLTKEQFEVVAASDREVVLSNVTRSVEQSAEIDGVTRTFLTTKSPYRDARGITIGTIGIARDISTRKGAEEKLRLLESRYRGLLEAAPDAMVVADAKGKITLLNAQAEKQFGYLRDELVGQPMTVIIPQGYAEPGIQLIGHRKDGSEFPIELMLSPIESPEGTLITAAIRDISVRKRVDEQLEKTLAELKRSNDELEQFAYVASHDLQEPLRMVASYTRLLAERYKGQLDSNADDFIEFAVDGANRMRAMIQALLDYSRAGTDTTAPGEISSEQALEEALVNLQVSVAESGAVITHDALPRVTMHAVQLTQIFQNLVGNAIKYRGPKAPRIHVSAARAGNDWSFAVRDNGVGIAPEFFQRIFVLFQRLHGGELVKGSGIGLSVCKKMLERMGGRIWVESPTTGGSTFHFAFPSGR